MRDWIEDVELFCDGVVSECGGQRVDEILSKGHQVPNADYIFEVHGVVAELKCLEKDQYTDPVINKKMDRLLNDWHEKGLPFKVQRDPSTNSMRIDNITPSQSEQILLLHRKPIHKHVVKANKQIRETKRALNRPDLKGLLLMANNNNAVMSVHTLECVISYSLAEGACSSIDGYVLFAPNSFARMPGIRTAVMPWVIRQRGGHPEVGYELGESLSRVWSDHFARLTGKTIAEARMPEESLPEITIVRPRESSTDG